jgi:predicted nucleic acid-binding protein
MIAVTDASPICYLVLIGEVDLLASLSGRVVVPRRVLDELLDKGAPVAVRDWAAAPPDWISIHDAPAAIPTGLERLHAGERAAILLAESVKADLILLDEKYARRVAAERGLRVTGVLGVLVEAANRGLVDLALSIDKLRKTGFRGSPALLKAALDRFTMG